MKKICFKSPTVGEYWYPIDKKWYDSWERYTMFNKGNDDIPGGIDNLHKIGEPRPGKIDNSALQDTDNAKALKRDIQENLTHIWIHEQVWKLFCSWYEGGPAFPRKVFERGNTISKEKFICIYPQSVQVIYCDDKTGQIKVNSDAKIAQFPPDYTLKQIMKEVNNDSKEDDVEDNMRLWLKFGDIKYIYPLTEKEFIYIENEDQNRWVEVPNDYLRVQLDDISDIKEDCILVIEKKKDDGSWPRAKGNNWRETLQTGDIIDVKDKSNKWYESLIRYVYPSDDAKMGGKCMVHYIGWSYKWNEVLEISNIKRLASRNEHSKGAYRRMNSTSTIQCSAQSPQLTNYFLQNDYIHHLGWNGRVAKAKQLKTKSKASFTQFTQQCIKLKYKSTNIFTQDDYIKPNANHESHHYIPHSNLYSLTDLLRYTKNKNRNNKRNIKYNSTKNEKHTSKKHQLYNDKYLSSNNDCKWIKLKQGKFFNTSFYIFNNNNNIHSVEIIQREQQQNIDCITYFLQNLIEEIYPNSNNILASDIAFVIGEFCRGYLTAQCYNNKCNESINFFYEDRYNKINTYFYLSDNFENDNILYCSDCFMNDKFVKCECGHSDLNHKFNEYICYNYNKYDPIIIDEFNCACNTHQMCCSRHIKCIKCKLSPCNECEILGWCINENGLCLKCEQENGCEWIECDGCCHIFDEQKMNVCVLCKHNYCNNIKWKQFDINKINLSEKYEMYLNTYKCECNWKKNYFDAPHNLLYPIYSEWKRRMELRDNNNKCFIENRFKCLECDAMYAVCGQCDYSDHENKMIICDKCIVNNKMKCDLCQTDFIQCYEYGRNNIIYSGFNEEISLNHMINRECVECDEMCHICIGCYKQNYGEYLGLYLCLKCKRNNRRKCMHCENIYYNHMLWDKIMGGARDNFRYFMDDIKCENKGCKCKINGICNVCYDIYSGQCLQCLHGSICVKCDHKIINYNEYGYVGNYTNECSFCFDNNLYLSKTNNCFKSNWIDKKFKNCHKKRTVNKKKHRRGKGGKFIYNIEYNKGFGASINILSKWKKYKNK